MAAAARWQAVERKARLAGNGLLLPRGATPHAAAFRHVPGRLHLTATARFSGCEHSLDARS